MHILAQNPTILARHRRRLSLGISSAFIRVHPQPRLSFLAPLRFASTQKTPKPCTKSTTVHKCRPHSLPLSPPTQTKPNPYPKLASNRKTPPDSIRVHSRAFAAQCLPRAFAAP